MSVDAVSQVRTQENRTAWVRFTTEAVENKAETLKQGKWVGTDVEMVHITSPYTKDEHDKKVTAWLALLDLQLMQGRIPRAHYDYYKAQYKAWKDGQEMPLNGTPIKGWPMISPAQQQVLISCRILTVEDLAGINDDGIRQIGMGAVDMKGRAIAFLAQATDKGPLTMQMAATEARNRELEIKVNTLMAQVEGLVAAAQVMGQTAILNAPPPPTTQITATGLGLTDHPTGPVAATPVAPLEPPPAVTTMPKRHRRSKAEMEAARLVAVPPAPPAPPDPQEI